MYSHQPLLVWPVCGFAGPSYYFLLGFVRPVGVCKKGWLIQPGSGLRLTRNLAYLCNLWLAWRSVSTSHPGQEYSWLRPLRSDTDWCPFAGVSLNALWSILNRWTASMQAHLGPPVQFWLMGMRFRAEWPANQLITGPVSKQVTTPCRPLCHIWHTIFEAALK